MNMKLSGCLLAGLASVSAFAQDASPKPIYLGATYVFNEGDLRKFAGGKVMSYAFEAGYELAPPTDIIGSRVYARYMRTFGDRREGSDFPAGGTKLHVDAWTGGLDLTFATPVKGLVPYAGMNVTFYDGSKSESFLAPKFSFEDSKPKFGIRLGVEYQINATWSASVDYTFTEWRSASKEVSIQGVNPLNPSWVGVSARYHFAY